MTRALLGAATLVGAAAAVAAPLSPAAGRLRAMPLARSAWPGASGASGPSGPSAGSGGAGADAFRRRAALAARRRLSEAPGALAAPVAGLAALGAAVAGGVLGGVVGAAVAAAYAAGGVGAVVRGWRARQAEVARSACADALAGLADDLRAGGAPLVALRAALRPIVGLPGVSAVLAGIDRGGAVTAMRAVRGPLASALHRLAAAWSLTDAGIPLADVVDRLDAELRADRQSARRAAGRTASARVTARLVAALPVVGIGMGQALGAEPLRVLTGTPVGAVCAVTATALHLLGFAWAGRIARSAA